MALGTGSPVLQDGSDEVLQLCGINSASAGHLISGGQVGPKCPLLDPQVAGNSPVSSHGCKLSPSVAERVAGKPGLFAGGKKSYFRYSSQGVWKVPEHGSVAGLVWAEARNPLRSSMSFK